VATLIKATRFLCFDFQRFFLSSSIPTFPLRQDTADHYHQCQQLDLRHQLKFDFN
jgi:hypothetical protein